MIVRRYLATEIYRATLLVLLVLVGLFTFFSTLDLINDINKTFTLWRLLQLQLVQIPTRLYDLLPVALLIGAVSALASLANRSELIIYRVCGISAFRLVRMLWLTTLPIIVLAGLLSEFVTPPAELAVTRYSVQYLGNSLSGTSFYSGYWFREHAGDKDQRVINIRRLDGNGQLHNVIVYRFNTDHGVFVSAQRARLGYFDHGDLVLKNVTEIRSTIEPQALMAQLKPLIEGANAATAHNSALGNVAAAKNGSGNAATAHSSASATAKTGAAHTVTAAQTPPDLKWMDRPGAVYQHLKEVRLPTTLNAQRVYASQMQPDRMDTKTLIDYIAYLKSNQLQTRREDIALWRKLSYPFTLLVMVLLAAPIGFIHTRKGGMGLKVFTGIVLGVVFFMLNQLALSVGVIDNVPSWAAAVLPNLVAAILAFLALYRIEVLNMRKRGAPNPLKERKKDA